MKKKPHQKQSAIKNVFSDFRERLQKSKHPQNGVRYEVVKGKNGYTLIIHQERGANQTLHFESKQELDGYLDSV